MFYFIEDTPLLCILRDFLPELDEFFSERESHLSGINFEPDINPSQQEEIIFNLLSKLPDKAGAVQEKEIVRTKKKNDEGGAGVGVEEEEEDGSSAANVDEDYVHVLEIYCLLKQRLLDVKYNWKTVVKDALSDHGRNVGKIIFINNKTTFFR